MFLDLSLPVSDEVMRKACFIYIFILFKILYVLKNCVSTKQAYRKKNQKKVQKSSESPREDTSSPTLTSGNDDLPGSKYQQKKAKKQAKKQAKVDWVLAFQS